MIPVNDNAYHDARRDLSFAPHETLDLDGRLHLNPALSGLKDIWDSEELAIVRGAGYPKQDRSHFRSMDIWQTASLMRRVDGLDRGAGSTQGGATTRCGRSTSDRCCRRWPSARSTSPQDFR